MDMIVKPPFAHRQIATVSSTAGTANGKIKIPLDKNRLVSEYILDVSTSQTIGTNAPTSSDVRDAFTMIQLVSDIFGVLVSMPFAQYYDLVRFTENTPVPVVALGAGGGAAATARFFCDVECIMDEATLGMLTALQTADHGSLYLELTCASNAANHIKGGTGTMGDTSYTVIVEEKSYPEWSGKNISVAGLHYGRAYQVAKSLEESTGVAAVKEVSTLLETGGNLRFLLLHAYNTTGTYPVLANGILDAVTSLEIGGKEYALNRAAEGFQNQNIRYRNFNQTGVYVIDFGDDHRGWPNMNGLNEVRLKYKTKASAPAGWKIQVAQVRALGLEKAFSGK